MRGHQRLSAILSPRLLGHLADGLISGLMESLPSIYPLKKQQQHDVPQCAGFRTGRAPASMATEQAVQISETRKLGQTFVSG